MKQTMPMVMISDAAGAGAWSGPSAEGADRPVLPRGEVTHVSGQPVEDQPRRQAVVHETFWARCRHRCGMLSIGQRASLLVVLAVGGGLGAGLLIAGTHQHPGLALVLCVTIVGLGLAGVWWWISEPLSQLSGRIEHLTRGRDAGAIEALPTERHDELGRLARAVGKIRLASIRHEHEASRLRRTLDANVVSATRRATRQLERLATRDALTGLGNRRLLDERLPLLAAECQRDGKEVVCIMMDLDNFKQVNDQLGHAVGDELLSLLGGLILASVRPEDLAVRLGGDEFIIVLPDTSVRRAGELVNHLRDLLRQQVTALYPPGPWGQLSAGIAAMERDGCEDMDRLIVLADNNLYAAKRSGKGCTREAGNQT